MLKFHQVNSQFDEKDTVKMAVCAKGYTVSENFVIRKKRQDCGNWEYQLNKTSGEAYKGGQWFPEDRLYDV